MNEREYIEFVTPKDNHKIRIKAWLTARERRSIRGVLLDGIKFSVKEGEENPISDYNLEGSSLDKMQDIALTTVVISVNEKTDNILDTILEMKEKDFDFIVKEIDKITGSIDEETKKK